MSKSFTLNQLTEGIRDRNVGAEGQRLISKWTRTGLLRGLNEHKRETMSRLLENQAAQLLRESNTVGSGGYGATARGGSGSSSEGINGFTNIAFPIVRRVFGGLIANELVSIQPMSLPSGLLFYLDYTYGSNVGIQDVANDANAKAASATYSKGQSIYNSPGGRGVQSGSLAVGGQYDLAGSGYSLVHSSSQLTLNSTVEAGVAGVGGYAGSGAWANSNRMHATGSDGVLLQFDPQVSSQIENSTGVYQAIAWDLTHASLSWLDKTQSKSIGLVHKLNATNFQGLHVVADAVQGGKNLFNVRRLNQIGTWDATANTWTSDAIGGSHLLTIVSGAWMGPGSTFTAANLENLAMVGPVGDTLQAGQDGTVGSTITIPSFESDFESSPSPNIPEIDIKIESIAVTATTRKLRARWSPELAQDLNAYHSLDAEVELTQILSEQIALEIDREILNDLLTQAGGANYYWSRMPGKFVNKTNGSVQNLASTLAVGPSFTGTVREWYETLVETIIDVGNEIHRKTLRGSANFIVCSPEVATIFEASVLYKPAIKIDGDGQVGAPFSLGAANIGSLSNRFTVYKDPYFPRNKILVGYKGGSYLETGYVYAPYVPLIVTPTIFAPEDFTPRKGVMTRYGKKMVRNDFYGTVTVMDMNVI